MSNDNNNNKTEARKRDLERIKAEARAYAFSSMTRKKEREREKFSAIPPSMVGRARRRLPPRLPPYKGPAPYPPPPYGYPPPHHHHHHHPPYPPPPTAPNHHPHHYPYPPYHHHHHYPPPTTPQLRHPPLPAAPQAPQPHAYTPKTRNISSVMDTAAVANKPPPEPKPLSTLQKAMEPNLLEPGGKSFLPDDWDFENYDDDYGRFVKSLWEEPTSTGNNNDSSSSNNTNSSNNIGNEEEEDAEEFRLDKDEDEDNAAEDCDIFDPPGIMSDDPPSPSSRKEIATTLDTELFSLGGDKFYQELAEELGWLEEEDMEAAVTTLLDAPKTPATTPSAATNSINTNGGSSSSSNNAIHSPVSAPSTEAPSTPFREAARATHVTDTQYERLQALLQRHYQLMMQQTVLAARAAPAHSRTAESAADLVQIVNHATGMLQDIEQHRKNAILCKVQQGAPQRIMTRLKFSKTLQDQHHSLPTIFDVQGLDKLSETFAWIDKNVGDEKCGEGGRTGKVDHPVDAAATESSSTQETRTKDVSGHERILPSDTNAEACKKVLRYAGAQCDPELLPDSKEISELFADKQEILGVDFCPPATKEQRAKLLKNRNLFSYGEDNLVLQGVNLYGEKQWMLLADRLLPDRSVHIIAQRYAKLCVMLYKAHGIEIDEDGNLPTPPKYESIDDVDLSKAKHMKQVQAPAILNVHRWSLQEDLTTLRAVPIFGTMWAEIASRYLPHRDRGHIRKRYLVLQRRVKSATSREKRNEPLTPAKKVRAPSRPLTADDATTKSAAIEEPAAKPPTAPVTAKPRAKAAAVAKPKPAPRPRPPVVTRTPTRPVKRDLPVTCMLSPPGHFSSRAAFLSPTKSVDESSRFAVEKLVPDAGSRAAFESLVRASEEEKSQSDTESMVANTIITKLANSVPPPPPLGDGHDESSQFSALEPFQPSPSSRRLPIKREDARRERSMDENNLQPRATREVDSPFQSPKKARKWKVAETPTKRELPFTVGSPTSQVLCEFGAMLSPTLRNVGSPSMTLNTFPETSNLIKEEESSMDQNGCRGNLFNTPSPSKSVTSPGNHAGLFVDSALMENDLEAISALNSLSASSPAGAKAKSPAKSLFAKVVGRTREKAEAASKAKKRKLQF